jgi:hypothetical protein
MLRLLLVTLACLTARQAGAGEIVMGVPAAAFRAGSLPALARADMDGVMRASLPPRTGEAGSALAYGAIDSQLVAPRATGGRPPKASELGLQLPGGKSGGGKAAVPDDDDDDEDDAPTARPGSFSTSSTKIPSAFLKNRTVAPHTNSPDVSYDVNDKTTIGLFGDLNHTSRGDARSALSKPDRELGAGFTFQYKFGSH